MRYQVRVPNLQLNLGEGDIVETKANYGALIERGMVALDNTEEVEPGPLLAPQNKRAKIRGAKNE